MGNVMGNVMGDEVGSELFAFLSKKKSCSRIN